jgi:cytochrome P450
MAIDRAHLRFIRDFYSYRLRLYGNGYVRRDPVALIQLPTGIEDPYPLYERIRSQGRMVRTAMNGMVTVDHALCHELLRSRNYSAATKEAREAELSLLSMDPPDHTRIRAVIAGDFTVRRIQSYEPLVTSMLEKLIKAVPRDEPFDLVDAITAPLPVAVISKLFGIPDADTDEFVRLGIEFNSAVGGIQSLAHARRLLAARERLAQIMQQVLDRRRADPGDDMISRIVAADDAIRAEELMPLCIVLLVAGFGTTVNLIGNTVLALLNHPDQRQLLVERPELMEQAIEECLRYDPPVQRSARLTTVAGEIGGSEVPAGETIVIGIGGANRDPAVFSDPASYDITRPNAGEHISFSGGVHFCIGAPLARLEAIAAVRAIMAEFPGLRIAGPLERQPGGLVRGLRRFPVVDARTAA